MLCDAPGCKNVATHSGTIQGGDRISHSFNVCEKHLPIDLSPKADVGTVIVERPAVERVTLPADHPDAKSGTVVNTTNASGSTGLTGDTEEAKAARTKISDAASGSAPDDNIKADTKVKDPSKV